MLFTGSFRLMLCNDVYKEGRDIVESVIATRNQRNGYDLDQLCEQVLGKESYTTIYHLADTGKRPRKNNSQKIVRFKLRLLL